MSLPSSPAVVPLRHLSRDSKNVIGVFVQNLEGLGRGNKVANKNYSHPNGLNGLFTE